MREPSFRAIRILAGLSIAAAAVLAACSSSDPKPAVGCTLGETITCSCQDGTASTATCSALGGYGACACAPSTNTHDASGGDGGDGGDGGEGGDGEAGAVTACTGNGNVFVLSGDDGGYIYPGNLKIESAAFTVTRSDANYIRLYLPPPSKETWSVELATDKLGTALAAMTYTDAQRASFADTGHPGLDVYGDGRGCNQVFGQFTVQELTFTAGTLTHLIASFEQHCESKTAPRLLGCIKFDGPAGAIDAGADAGP